MKETITYLSSDSGNRPSIKRNYAEDEDYKYYSGRMKNESQPKQQHEQEQEQHPYASLYEPLLFATEPAEFGACPSSSSSSSSQQPEEVFSSATATEAEQSPLSPRSQINAISTIYRAKKRQKNDYSVQNNNIVENAVQSVRVVHEDDARMDLNEQIAHIVKTFLDDDIDHGHDSITDCRIDNVDDDDAMNSSDYRDDKAVIKHMKLATKKMKSKLQAVGTATARGTGFALDANTRVVKRNSAVWEEMYQRLVAYKKEYNDTSVSAKYTKDPKLGIWVRTQRIAHRNKKMIEKRKHLLNSIGFAWEHGKKKRKNNTKIHYSKWEEMYQQLIAYKKEHNDTKVPTQYYKDPKLGGWVSAQRAAYKNKKMNEERKRLLNSVGFVWTALTTTWEEMYQRLVVYKMRHNHSIVPQRNKEDPQLGAWVNKQRTINRNKNMKEERKRLLDSIGFVWVCV